MSQYSIFSMLKPEEFVKLIEADDMDDNMRICNWEVIDNTDETDALNDAINVVARDATNDATNDATSEIAKNTVTNAVMMHKDHLPSLFLKMIPVEIRLEIYNLALTGSQMCLSPDKSTRRQTDDGDKNDNDKKDNDNNDTDKDDKNVKDRIMTAHFGLPLTCRTIYNEAHNIYWSKTVLVCLKGPHANEKTHLLRFAARLHPAAKAHIRHLRDIDLRAIKYMDRGSFEAEDQDKDQVDEQLRVARLHAFLDQFPRLRSLTLPEFRSKFYVFHDPQVESKIELEKAEYMKSVIKGSPILDLAESRGFSVLVRQVWTFNTARCWMRFSYYRFYNKVWFTNLSTGTGFSHGTIDPGNLALMARSHEAAYPEGLDRWGFKVILDEDDEEVGQDAIQQ